MKRFKELLLIAGLSTLSLSGAFALWRFPLERVSAQSSEDHVIYLNQGWSPEVQEAYYHLSQGSTVMPYDVFLNLEAAGSQDLFRSDANSERYGLTPDPVNPRTNPDGLQIGLSKTTTQEGPWKGDDVGLTCASPICGSLTRLTTLSASAQRIPRCLPLCLGMGLLSTGRLVGGACGGAAAGPGCRVVPESHPISSLLCESACAFGRNLFA